PSNVRRQADEIKSSVQVPTACGERSRIERRTSLRQFPKKPAAKGGDRPNKPGEPGGEFRTSRFPGILVGSLFRFRCLLNGLLFLAVEFEDFFTSTREMVIIPKIPI